MNELKTQLVELLHSVAMYNDKGHMWCCHSHAESEAMRAKWRDEINDLISQIGKSQFSANLLDELYTQEVARDDSGLYAEKVSAWFSKTNDSQAMDF